MPTFEGWAKIELFGHRVLFGHVSEVTMFGATFARIEVPTEPPQVEFKSASAIYGITPWTEEQCRKQNEPWKPRPALSAPVEAEVVVDDDASDNWADDDDIETCGYCGMDMRGEPEIEVEDDNGDREVWHTRCAQLHAANQLPDPIDSDAPRSP